MGSTGVEANRTVIEYLDLAFLFDELDDAFSNFFRFSWLFFDDLPDAAIRSVSGGKVRKKRGGTLNDLLDGSCPSPTESLLKIGRRVKHWRDSSLAIRDTANALRNARATHDQSKLIEGIALHLTRKMESIPDLDVLLQAIDGSIKYVELMGEFDGDADRHVVREYGDKLLNHWEEIRKWNDQRSVQLLGEWGTRFFYVLRHSASLPPGWLRQAMDVTIESTPKQRRKQHIHLYWKRLRDEEKLSYGQIAKMHNGQTGQRITSSAVAKALRRLGE
jgi:hypothetical protein